MGKRFKLVLKIAMLVLLFGFTNVMYAQRTVTGTVKDAKDGSALPGVNVTVKGVTGVGTVTNIDGKFTIAVPSEGNTLVFSFVGYTTQEVALNAQSNYEVMLEPSTQELEEVVVTALGMTKNQRSLGYAATTVESKKLTEVAMPNIGTALYGKIPGLRVSATPGGSTSGVAVQIRGVNSINGKTTPLVVLDGVPVRDGTFNNTNYWNDQRIRSNGLVDFNPEDIESITVLKGASAAALYGSEAVNGVLLITTKSGKGKKGFSVDVVANTSVDKVAYLPRWQKERGAGFDIGYGVYATDSEGFVQRTKDGTTYRALPQAGLNFGPKFDGKPILCWDGQVRPYEYQENGFANLFQTAHNYLFNVAVTNNTENSMSRFSYTYNHTEGLSLESRNDKNNFNLNNTYKLGKRVTTDIVVNYMNWKIHNRPYMIDRLINNFGGMFPSFDNGLWYIDKYKTSLGYKYVTGSNQSVTPDENIIYPNFRSEIADYVWNVKEKDVDEMNNRLNAVAKVSWEIINGLRLQLRSSTDFTSIETQNKESSEKPIAFGPTGYFGQSNSNYTILYGDAILTYEKKLTDNLELNTLVGYNARKEDYKYSSAGTNGGLSTENKFDLKASQNTANASSSQSYFITDAVFGQANISYKNYLFGEFTLRRDRTSTMNPDNNTFTYPSVNTGLIFSDAFQLPDFISFGKLRFSWGIVGNYPDRYLANPAYSLGNLGNQGNGSVLITTIRNEPYGNSVIKPEEKHEYEFGLDLRFFQNRLNFDVSYYNAKIVDQILSLSLPISSGAKSILTNIGTLQNTGVEIGINGRPIALKDFTWESGLNLYFNRNEVKKLTTGSNELLHANYDGDAAKLVSTVGQPMGDWYAHPIATDAQGRKIISSDGTYVLDAQKWEKYGNAMPKATGGLYNTLTYKNFALDFMIDFRFGGSVMPTGLYWLTCRGLTEESLKVPEGAKRSGIRYYVDENWVGHETTAATGPNGEVVMEDGIILDGVLADGTENTNVISKSLYYWYSYNWGGPQYGSSLYYKYINKNSYAKMREISLSYTLPSKLSTKLGVGRLQVSVFGRNLFYLYRTIKDMDAEQLSAGSYWSTGLNNAGTNPSSRSYGVMLRASF
jgi:TonB-linked SusC/RagA family outer membrane protein